jgi:hypothetical protein
MKRSLLNYIVDMGMLLSFVAVLLTGISKFPILLQTLAKRGVYFPSNEITLIHKWGGTAMAACILLHLILHWNWVLSATRSYLGKRSGSYQSEPTE